MKALSVFLFAAVVLSCAVKYRGNGPYKEVLESHSTPKPGISFLTVTLKRIENKPAEISFNTYQEVAGEIKLTDEFEKKPESKYLVQLLDEKGKPLRDFYLYDVLLNHGEVFYEDGEIVSFEEELTDKEVVLRFNSIEEKFERIVLFELDSTGKEHFAQVIDCNY